MAVIIQEDCAFPDTMEIEDVGGSGFGMRVLGRVNGYEFAVLVFPEHARNSQWEWGLSRISEITLRRKGSIVFQWGRGPAVDAMNDEVKAATSIIAAYLADRVYPDPLAAYLIEHA